MVQKSTARQLAIEGHIAEQSLYACIRSRMPYLYAKRQGGFAYYLR